MKVLMFIFEIVIILFFILSVISVLIERKRKGHGWIGQGFGKK